MFSYSGINDKSCYEVEIEEKIEKTVLDTFRAFGFQKIALSSVERSELFLKKIGDRIKSEMIIFKDHQNKEFCLRPEITSSTLRYYLNHLENETRPIKLCYSGKVFRNGWGDESTIKETTHIGVETIDVDHVHYDAENIALSWECLKNLELDNYKIIVGNVGIIRDLVDKLDLDSAFKNFFLENIKNKDTDKDFFLKAIEEDIHPANEYNDYKDIVHILKKLSQEEERVLLKKLLHYVHPHFSKELDEAEDIIDGILDKIKREKQLDVIHNIIDFSKQLQMIQGSPDDAFQKAEKLILEFAVQTKHLDELKQQVQYLLDYGVPVEKISIDFSLGRNLQYYTGIVFEIEITENNLNFSVCGGGRYDNFVEAKNKKISGSGFAFFLDELKHVMLEKLKSIHKPAKANFYIQAVNPELLSLAKTLRIMGYKVFTVFTENENDIDLRYFHYIIKPQKSGNKYELFDSISTKMEELSLDDIQNKFKPA